MPRHGAGEITIFVFDQQKVAELHGFTHIGEVILAAIAAIRLACQTQEDAGVANVVEGDVGERDVLFEHRPMAAPFRQTVAEDEVAIAKS